MTRITPEQAARLVEREQTRRLAAENDWGTQAETDTETWYHRELLGTKQDVLIGWRDGEPIAWYFWRSPRRAVRYANAADLETVQAWLGAEEPR